LNNPQARGSGSHRSLDSVLARIRGTNEQRTRGQAVVERDKEKSKKSHKGYRETSNYGYAGTSRNFARGSSICWGGQAKRSWERRPRRASIERALNCPGLNNGVRLWKASKGSLVSKKRARSDRDKLDASPKLP